MAHRNDDDFKSHPNEPYSYQDNRTPERKITDEGVMQHIGPRWKLSVSETSITGTVTLIISDPAHTVRLTTPVEFVQDGSTNAPTTAPAGVNGTYTYTFTKDPKHNIIVSPIIHLENGTDIKPGSETFDVDDAANVVSVSITTSGTTANFLVQFDTDTGVGSGKGQYSLDNGGSYTNFTTTSARTGTFTIAQTSSEQALLIRGKDSAGTAGPAVASTVPALNNSLLVFAQISSTVAVITWTGFNVELNIDNAGWGAPPADDDLIAVGNQITVTRTTTNHVYAFRSSVGSQYASNTIIVPALGATGGGDFSGLTNVLSNAATDQILFSWAWSGATATFNVYVSDGGGPYALEATTGSGATSYLYTSIVDITVNHADPTRTIGFYVEAIVGSTIGARSINTVTTYNYL